MGTVVHIYRDGAAYEVEFATVLPAQLRPVGRQDIAHARELAI